MDNREDNMKTIPPFKLEPRPMNEEAAQLPGFKWAGKDIGKRHQLGGSPFFVQPKAAEYPVCDDCGKTMLFYAQLDSINDEYCIADCGMIYVFVCIDCNTVKSFIQSA